MSVMDMLSQPHETGSETKRPLVPIYPYISLLPMHILPPTPSSDFLVFFRSLFPLYVIPPAAGSIFIPGHLCAIGLVRGSDLSLSELRLFSICLPLHQRYIQAGPYAFISHMPFAHLPRGFASVYGLVIPRRWKEGSTFLHVCYFTLPCPKLPDGLPVLSFSLICWSDPSNAVSSMNHNTRYREAIHLG